jgi:adenylate cyclase
MATARVERRLAAILAADVAGYSRLMERDEAGTSPGSRRSARRSSSPSSSATAGASST